MESTGAPWRRVSSRMARMTRGMVSTTARAHSSASSGRATDCLLSFPPFISAESTVLRRLIVRLPNGIAKHLTCQTLLVYSSPMYSRVHNRAGTARTPRRPQRHHRAVRFPAKLRVCGAPAWISKLTQMPSRQETPRCRRAPGAAVTGFLSRSRRIPARCHDRPRPGWARADGSHVSSRELKCCTSEIKHSSPRAQDGPRVVGCPSVVRLSAGIQRSGRRRNGAGQGLAGGRRAGWRPCGGRI